MKLNIMTWNTAITENLEDEQKCNQIINYIEDFLEKENSIAFLQQIAFKDPNNNWKMHSVFRRLKENYLIEFYKKSTFMMTVAITKKNNFLYPLEDEFYPINRPKNRAVAVKFNDISFLAIHAENDAKNADVNKSYLCSLHGKADVILGDFNTGNYLEAENRITFNQILKEHICICSMPTKVTETGRRTCIDHVFVRENMITKCCNLIVHEDVLLSDHFPMTFEINK